ncbi:MAG: hypothetical protein HFJ52_04210 [Clostridia bacterium]|nr:hypothetical protein [Clostridia bacterium]
MEILKKGDTTQEIKEAKKMTVTEAAKIIGRSPQFVRNGLKQKRLEFRGSNKK